MPLIEQFSCKLTETGRQNWKTEFRTIKLNYGKRTGFKQDLGQKMAQHLKWRLPVAILPLPIPPLGF